MFNLKQQNAKNTVINELLVIFKDILAPFSKTIFLDLITKDSIFYMFYVNRYLNLFPVRLEVSIILRGQSNKSIPFNLN